MEQISLFGSTCCFSGYRPQKLPWGEKEDDPRCIELKKMIADAVLAAYECGVRHFICGMALGCDTYFCEAVLALREEYGDVTVEAALPCETQASGWGMADRDRYFDLVAQCDVETMVSHAYTPDCMVKRNRYMIEHSSMLICVYDGAFGGTMQSVNYAQKLGLEIIQIKPPV